MKYLIILFSFLPIVLISNSCRKDTTLPPTYIDQGNIGINGGIIKTADGASVEIPAGAINSDKTISITKTTTNDTITSSGSKIYSLKPDGQTFLDSIIITLPFDDKYIDLNNQKENYEVSIMVFQDSTWIKLKTEVDLKNKTASAKTTHFSLYNILFPSTWSDYFNKNVNSDGVIYSVPYYHQVGEWCFYYSLSMLSKYHNHKYLYKGPYLASFFNETTTGWGFTTPQIIGLKTKLKSLGLSAEMDYIWTNVNEMCGKVLYYLKNGYPVLILSGSLEHAFIVSGYDQTGFYINDPNEKTSLTKQYPYNQFKEEVESGLSGAEYTLIITSSGTESKNGLSLDFGEYSINITSNADVNHDATGFWDINGKYKPNGFSFINLSWEPGSFNGSDFIHFQPLVANSERVEMDAKLYVKIDDKNIVGSPQTLNNIPRRKADFMPLLMSSRLSNLQKGIHKIEVDLRSSDSQILYDQWDLEINISNEFFEIIPPSILVNTFGPEDSYTEGSGWALGYENSSSSIQAIGFIPSISGNVSQYEIAVFRKQGGTQLIAWLLSDNNNYPGNLVEKFSFTVPMGSNDLILSANSSVHPLLIAGMRYWLVVAPPDISNELFGWYRNPSIPGVLNAQSHTAFGPWNITVGGLAPTLKIIGQ